MAPVPPGAGRRPHSRGTRSGCRRPAATRRRRGACARPCPCTRPCRAATPVSGSTKPNAHGHSWWPACHPAHSPAGRGEDAGAETDGCAELRWSRRRGTVRRPLTASARRRAEPPEGGTAVPAASPQRQDSARLAARGGGAGSRRPEHLAAPPTSLPSAERKGHATSIPPPPGSRPRNGASANGSVWSRCREHTRDLPLLVRPDQGLQLRAPATLEEDASGRSTSGTRPTTSLSSERGPLAPRLSPPQPAGSRPQDGPPCARDIALPGVKTAWSPTSVTALPAVLPPKVHLQGARHSGGLRS